MQKQRTLTQEDMENYARHLRAEERSPGTVEKYLRDVRAFRSWAGERLVTKELASGWKEHLMEQGYAPSTINSMLGALNGLFQMLGWDTYRVKFLKIQRCLFRDEAREMTRQEYEKLLNAAKARGQERLALLMETICAAGIRVSEVKYITVEAAQRGRTDISLKGKVRTILLPGKLCRKLLKYAKKQKTVSGEIFLTRNGRGMNRRQIWMELKRLCKYTGVAPSKVFPHNFRHLFATTFYRRHRDIARLADILGHCSIETTRIYLVTSGAEHSRQLAELGLVS